MNWIMQNPELAGAIVVTVAIVAALFMISRTAWWQNTVITSNKMKMDGAAKKLPELNDEIAKLDKRLPELHEKRKVMSEGADETYREQLEALDEKNVEIQNSFTARQAEIDEIQAKLDEDREQDTAMSQEKLMALDNEYAQSLKDRGVPEIDAQIEEYTARLAEARIEQKNVNRVQVKSTRRYEKFTKKSAPSARAKNQAKTEPVGPLAVIDDEAESTVTEQKQTFDEPEPITQPLPVIPVSKPPETQLFGSHAATRSEL